MRSLARLPLLVLSGLFVGCFNSHGRYNPDAAAPHDAGSDVVVLDGGGHGGAAGADTKGDKGGAGGKGAVGGSIGPGGATTGGVGGTGGRASTGGASGTAGGARGGNGGTGSGGPNGGGFGTGGSLATGGAGAASGGSSGQGGVAGRTATGGGGMGGAPSNSKCGSDVDCGVVGYCEGSMCLPPKAAGTGCNRSEQCASHLCGGRCCPDGMSCKCSQPGSTNLLKNAGFDRDIAGWGTAVTASWSNLDAEGCPFSGSNKYTGSASGDPKQCVPVSGGVRYNVGARFKKDNGGTWDCYLGFFPNRDCTGDPGSGNVVGHFRDPSIDYKPSDWIQNGDQVVAPSWATSAFFNCDSNNVFIDMAYVSPNPDTF